MATNNDGRQPSEKELQHKIGQTRDSLRTTVEAIQDKAEQQYESVKQTVFDVLDYRDEFQKEPVVWSLGALSAGFALVTPSATRTKWPRQANIRSLPGSQTVWWVSSRTSAN